MALSAPETGGQPAGPAPDNYPGPMAYAGIGMLGAVCLGAGGVLGWLADSALGTLPVFLLVGLLAGAAAAVLGARAELRRYKS
jgi:hypothetical protein